MYSLLFVDERSTGIFCVKNYEIRNILLFLLNKIKKIGYKAIENFQVIEIFCILFKVFRKIQKFISKK